MTNESVLNFEELAPPRRVVFVVEKKDFPQSSLQAICVKSSLSVVGYQAGKLIQNSGFET
ncbi:MAG TPA: hypothetical protein VN456_16040 [Desulfosporosinus sp.]|nr:hypothetical protein [Desulfosporosinus sp.]